MKRMILLVLFPIILFSQTKYFLPVDIVTSSGRGINNKTVWVYPTGTTENGVQLTYLSGSSGVYYWTGGEATVAVGNYDIYVDYVLWRENISINYGSLTTELAQYADSARTADGRYDFDNYFDSNGEIDTTWIDDSQWIEFVQNHDESGGDMSAADVRDSVVAVMDDSSVSKLGQTISDAEVDNNITVSSYLLLTATNDSVIAVVNRASEADVDTTNLAGTEWYEFIQNHQTSVTEGSSFADSAQTADGKWDFDLYFDASGDIDTLNLSTVWYDYIQNHQLSSYLLLSDFADSVAALDTDDISEGSTNLYHVVDTLEMSWGVVDTVYVEDLPGKKCPFDLTIIEIAGYTDANTTTFNIEERAETTPNTSGTDAMASDLVADNNQQESTSFDNANFDQNDWMVPSISATGDVAVFGITVRYVKQ